jgi:hypothetical protein
MSQKIYEATQDSIRTRHEFEPKPKLEPTYNDDRFHEIEKSSAEIFKLVSELERALNQKCDDLLGAIPKDPTPIEDINKENFCWVDRILTTQIDSITKLQDALSRVAII